MTHIFAYKLLKIGKTGTTAVIQDLIQQNLPSGSWLDSTKGHVVSGWAMTRRARGWSGSPFLNDAAAIISEIRLASFPHDRRDSETQRFPDSAMARSLKGTPGLKNGTTGHCHGTVGYGMTGTV